MKRKTGFLVGIMVVLCLISFVIIKVAGGKNINPVENEDSDEIVILTSFYPMYVLTLNLVDGVDGVRVVNLTENQTGCVHDYQLTTKDMREIADADIIILNSGEMEEFMEGVIDNYPELKVIDASEGIEFLKGIAHDHDHEEAEGDHEEDHTTVESEHEEGNVAAESDHEEDHTVTEYDHEEDHAVSDTHEEVDSHHHHSDINGHVWMNMDLYQKQIMTVTSKLSEYDKANADVYRKNAQSYSDKVNALKEEFQDVYNLANGKEIVIFHDAFAYLAQQLNMEVVGVVNTDSESALSAGELAEVVEEIKLHSIKYLFTEEQYSTVVANRVAKETDATVYVMDSLVTGKADKDAYLIGMRNNLEMLRQAFSMNNGQS